MNQTCLKRLFTFHFSLRLFSPSNNYIVFDIVENSLDNVARFYDKDKLYFQRRRGHDLNHRLLYHHFTIFKKERQVKLFGRISGITF